MEEQKAKELIQKLTQFSLSAYVHILTQAKTKPVQLFRCFPQTGTANISDPYRVKMFNSPEILLPIMGNGCFN